MCSPPSGCMPTTPPCRCSTSGGPAPEDCGPNVRDDRPFAGADPPAAAYFYSPDRRGEHPEAHLASWAGLMQADAYAGYDPLHVAGRQPGPIVEAAFWAHARRKVFDLPRLTKPPLAVDPE